MACSSTLVVLDEAYVNFIDKSWNSLPYIHDGNLIVLRSMTKDYALTAIRIGYLVAHKHICKQLYKVLSPWNVNSYAQAAIVDIFSKQDGNDYLIKTKQITSSVKEYLKDEFKKLDIIYIPSSTNFILIKLPNLENKKRLFLKYGILVRDCESYGLDDYIRVAIRTRSEMNIFLNAVQSIIKNRKSYAGR